MKFLDVCPCWLLVSCRDFQQQSPTPHTLNQGKTGFAFGYGRALQDAPPAFANELAVKLGGTGCQAQTRRQDLIRGFSKI